MNDIAQVVISWWNNTCLVPIYMSWTTAIRVYIMNELTCLYPEQDVDGPEKYLNI